VSKKKYSKKPEFLTQDSQAEVLTMTSEPTITKADRRDKKAVIAMQKAQAEHKISKKFGSHLDALFQDTMTPEEPEPIVAERKTKPTKRSRKIIPRLGLDSLIRNTRMLSSEDAMANDESKRVTFIYSKNQLEKVRQISKYESRFMKDIIGEAVNQWLERYERKLMKANG